MKVARRRCQPAARRSSAAVGPWIGLVVALLLAQTLGLLHAVVHHGPAGLALRWAAVPAVPPALSPTASRPAVAAAINTTTTTTRPLGWAGELFAGHDAGSSTCALYDQLVQPVLPFDAACVANPAFAPPLPAEPPRIGQIAPQAVGFLARGPPPQMRQA